MDANRELDCTIFKYVKVPIPRYVAVLTILTLGSLDEKELYEVSISNFPFCNCKDFKYMSTRALGKQIAQVDALQAFVLSSQEALLFYQG